jgi:peptidylprolyl isomerase/peptidyl-prolyl cis-trans isomerase B (cyclophilin B)
MKKCFRAGLLVAALLLSGCDHHQAVSHNSNHAAVPQGDSALTGAPVQPIDSMKSYPRAKLVALPGQPIPHQAGTSAAISNPEVPANSASLPPTTPTEAPAQTVSTAPPAASTPSDMAGGSTSAPDASQAAAQAPAADSGTTAPPPMPADTASATPGQVGAASTPPPATVFDSSDNSEVVVIETSLGRIIIELDDFAAPKTCKNFRQLIADGFYNNTVFHRVIPNFIIQGGDPKSKSSASDRNSYGLGSPGYTIPPEIALKHDRGAVAMARLPDSLNPQRESNGSQFYICLAPCPSLDDQYTVFGHVIQGLDVAQKIAAQPRDARDNPLQRIEMTVTLQPKDQAMANASTASP